jgi:hypothetical protein
LGARPGGKDLLGKNHEAASVSWTGRANPPNPPGKVFSSSRGDRPGATSARRILRKLVKASGKRASPADAFYPEAPCPRATTQERRKCQTLIVSRQSRGFTFMKLNFIQRLSFREFYQGAWSKSREDPGIGVNTSCDGCHLWISRSIRIQAIVPVPGTPRFPPALR